MLARPYGPYTSSYVDTFRTDRTYYGYFDSNKKYSYNSSGKYFYEDPNGEWDGNFLNWASMTRIDVARKVLTGGKWVVEGNDTLLVFNYDARHYLNKRVVLDAAPYTPFSGKVYIMRRRGPVLRFYKHGFTRRIGTYRLRIKISELPEGVIQKTSSQIRYGLMFFNFSQGGYIASYIRYSDEMEGDKTHIEKLVELLNRPLCDVGIGDTAIYSTWTPHAESYYEAMRYFRQDNPYYWSDDYQLADGGHPWRDPWYDSEAGDLIWCRKSFVIMVTDGEPTKDLDIPSYLQDYDNDGNDPIPPDQFQGDYPWRQGGSDYLDDVAYWSHINDMRSDLPGEQKITFYAIKAFGTPSVMTIWNAAITGGFIDKNNNDLPDDTTEWDADGDGIPDTYFEPERGEELELALYEALESILKRVSSASAVSIVSQASKGQGTVFQAYFLPSKLFGDKEILWIGQLHSLWIDQFGNLREDTDLNGILTLSLDRIVRVVFDTLSYETYVKRYLDEDGDGYYDESDFVDQVALDEINALWSAGEWLHQADPDQRNIYTFVDDGDGTVEDGEFIEFVPGEKDVIYPYLGVSSISEAESLIRYIRGEDVDGYRTRTFENHVWKLGDIVHSTPTFIDQPMERYDVIYKDQTYKDFFVQYKDRMPVIYVGANDGMLHAINAGKYHQGDSDATSEEDEGWIDGQGYELGEELWAYIPFNLLPHLKWLTDPDYCHVYYVDLKVKATDARIFNDDEIHPHGWGTLLIVGMRLGGTPIYVNGDTLRSAYFAIDVTDPTQPKPLWEFKDPKLGYTVSYPAVVKVQNSWYAVLSSGPVTLAAEPNSTGNGYLFVVDLLTGEKVREIPIGEDTPEGEALSNPIGVDVNIDYSVDVIYVGTYYETDSGWVGRVYRVQTHEDPDPNNWDVSLLVRSPGPVTAAPTSFMDSWGNLWVTFGTGRYFSEDDKWDESEQSFIALKDPNWSTGNTEIALEDLIDVTDVKVYTTDTGVVVTGLENVSTFEELVNVVSSHPGWRINLFDGERVLNKALVLGGAILFPTFIPNQDPCGFGGESRLYAVFYETGTAYSEPLLGTTAEGEHKKFVSLGEGMPSQPTLFVGEGGEKSFVQVSTGAIEEINIELPYSPRSRVVLWKGK
jgi:type IV pilus assembly protein PilY1